MDSGWQKFQHVPLFIKNYSKGNLSYLPLLLYSIRPQKDIERLWDIPLYARHHTQRLSLVVARHHEQKYIFRNDSKLLTNEEWEKWHHHILMHNDWICLVGSCILLRKKVRKNKQAKWTVHKINTIDFYCINNAWIKSEPLYLYKEGSSQDMKFQLQCWKTTEEIPISLWSEN